MMRAMLRLLTAGESHGPGLVGILEGLPAGVPVSLAAVRENSHAAGMATDAAAGSGSRPTPSR